MFRRNAQQNQQLSWLWDPSTGFWCNSWLLLPTGFTLGLHSSKQSSISFDILLHLLFYLFNYICYLEKTSQKGNFILHMWLSCTGFSVSVVACCPETGFLIAWIITNMHILNWGLSNPFSPLSLVRSQEWTKFNYKPVCTYILLTASTSP